jgi:hypothetical protein
MCVDLFYYPKSEGFLREHPGKFFCGNPTRDLRRSNIGIPGQELNDSDVYSLGEQTLGEGMSKDVNRSMFLYPYLESAFYHY